MKSGGNAAILAVILVAFAATAAGLIVHDRFVGHRAVSALFTTAIGIYPGDEVRVAGVKVGTVAAVDPQGTRSELTLDVDRKVRLPANVQAVIVAQNLVAARYVQLTPAYETSGPTLPDGAVIPLERTAVPVEWDDVKTQLMRLATELGPKAGASDTSVARFINSAADALDGNGVKLRQTLAELSGVGRILASGNGSLVDVLKNLATFVAALRDSGAQIVQFENRFAALTSVLDGSRSDLDSALTTLSSAIEDVRRFIAGTRDQTAEQIRRLANVTQTVADHRIDLENVLHVAPNAFSNGYNIYNPDTGSPIGAFIFNNFSNPAEFICGAIGGVENTTAPETAKLCAQYLGPALRLLNFNYLPIPINPYLAKSPSPANLVYSDPALAPGGAGTPPGPPDDPPAVSAYTGAGDVAPPTGFGNSGPQTGGSNLPAYPSPALFPGAPIPTVHNVPQAGQEPPA